MFSGISGFLFLFIKIAEPTFKLLINKYTKFCTNISNALIYGVNIIEL